MSNAPVSLRAFLHLVAPHVPAAPELAITFALRMAARDFCERTKCWRFRTTQVLTADEPAIVVPSYATVHEIEYIRWEGRDLTAIDWQVSQTSNITGADPQYFTQATPNTLAVVPYADGDVALSMFLKPRAERSFGQGVDGKIVDSFDQVPTFLLTQHAELLAHGALKRLFLTGAVAYANPDLGAYHGAEYERQVAPLARAYLRGQQGAPVRSKTHWF
jgi:hypothetical protein